MIDETNEEEDLFFFEDEEGEANESLTGDENWGAMWNTLLEWTEHGQHLRDVLHDKVPNVLLEYGGNDDDKKMQYIADNLNPDCPNKFLVEDISKIVNQWVMGDLSAEEAVGILQDEIFPDYFDGC